MRATFVISVEIDEGLVRLDAERHSRSSEQALREVVGDCECRLVDALRWRDAVVRVGSEVFVEPAEVRQ